MPHPSKLSRVSELKYAAAQATWAIADFRDVLFYWDRRRLACQGDESGALVTCRLDACGPSEEHAQTVMVGVAEVYARD